MKFSAYIMIFLVCAAFLIMPASAGVKYTSGSPDMDVKISGTNEFEPGSDVALTVIVSNTASLPEVVSGKVLRVPPRDVDALADAMERAIRQEWEEIPEKRFPLSEMIDKHVALYRKIGSRTLDL